MAPRPAARKANVQQLPLRFCPEPSPAHLLSGFDLISRWCELQRDNSRAESAWLWVKLCDLFPDLDSRMAGLVAATLDAAGVDDRAWSRINKLLNRLLLEQFDQPQPASLRPPAAINDQPAGRIQPESDVPQVAVKIQSA